MPRPLRSALVAAASVAALASASGAQPIQPGFVQQQIGAVAGSRAWGLAIADFTSDAVPDLVAGNTAGDVHLFEGNGDGTFTPRGVVIDMSFTDAFALGDGDPDLLLADQAHYLYVYRNDGQGGFAPIRYETIGSRPFALVRLSDDFSSGQTAIAAGDLNSDGLVDVVASVRNGSSGPDPATRSSGSTPVSTPRGVRDSRREGASEARAPTAAASPSTSSIRRSTCSPTSPSGTSRGRSSRSSPTSRTATGTASSTPSTTPRRSSTRRSST